MRGIFQNFRLKFNCIYGIIQLLESERNTYLSPTVNQHNRIEFRLFEIHRHIQLQASETHPTGILS